MADLPPEDQPDTIDIGSVTGIPIIEHDDPRFVEERAAWSAARAKAQAMHSVDELLAGLTDADWLVRQALRHAPSLARFVPNQKNRQSRKVPADNEGRVWAVVMAYRDRRLFEMFELLHPDIVWSRPGPTTYRGHEGVRQMLRDLQGETGGYTIRMSEVREVEPNLVTATGEVIVLRSRRRQAVTWQVHLRDGLVTEVHTLLPG